MGWLVGPWSLEMKLWPCNSVCAWVLLYYRVGRWKRPSGPSNPSPSPCRNIPCSTVINVLSTVVFREPNNCQSPGDGAQPSGSCGKAAFPEIYQDISLLYCISLFLVLL